MNLRRLTPVALFALMYVTQHPNAKLLAVTLAGTGESHCTEGTSNTRALLASVGLADVPVACGQEQPIGPGNKWPDECAKAPIGSTASISQRRSMRPRGPVPTPPIFSLRSRPMPTL